MNVQSAIAEAKRVAQAHCPRCGDGPIPVLAARAGTPHTCEADIVAARALALEAFDAGVEAGQDNPDRMAYVRAEIEGMV